VADASQRHQGEIVAYLDEHAGDIVSALSALVRVPSVCGTDEENAIQDLLAAELTSLGMEVDHWEIPLERTAAAAGFPGTEVDRRQAWGLVGRLPGSAAAQALSLMVNAHVDVVPAGDLTAWDGDPFSGRVDATAVHGRGSCDMKGGLVAGLWAVRALRDLGVPLRGDLLLACVQGEEDGGLGTFATLERGWRADACVIPEPTSLDLVPASAGALTFRLTVPGLAAHASRRTSGVSAVEKLLPVFTALRALEADRNREGGPLTNPLMAPWDIPYAIEIGTVRAGDWSSSVPDLLVAEGRYGVALGESIDAARAAFEDAITGACAADPWLRDHPVTVQWWGGQFASAATPVDSAVVDLVREAHALAGGCDQGMWGAPYGSDLRLMTGLGGVPTVHYGPGDARLAHGPREHVPVAEVLMTAKTLALAAVRQCTTDRALD
jgi:acetylornithine deacetylase